MGGSTQRGGSLGGHEQQKSDEEGTLEGRVRIENGVLKPRAWNKGQ